MIYLKIQQTNTGQLWITLSRPIARALNLKKGDIVHWYLNTKGELCLKKDGNNTKRHKEKKGSKET